MRSWKAWRARSRRTARPRICDATRMRSCAVMIHGDAAFSGQGVVPETLNLAQLRAIAWAARCTLSRTTRSASRPIPAKARSTDYSSDVARGFDIPIFHVNADDPEACLAVVRLALAFRDTVPLRCRHRPDRLPPIRPQRSRRARIHAAGDVSEHRRAPDACDASGRDNSIREGVVTSRGRRSHLAAEVRSARRSADRRSRPHKSRPNGERDARRRQRQATGASALDTRSRRARSLAQLDKELHTWPREFAVNPKLARQLERRARIIGETWGDRMGPRRSAGVRIAADPRACPSA